MLSDEDLATIAMNAGEGSGYLSLAGIPPRVIHKYLRIVRAIRTALCPPVTPLAPGAMVTIPHRWWLPTDTVYAGLTLNESACYPDLSVIADDGEVGVRVRLDTAGVAALIETCQRWLSAQNETQVVKTGLQSASGAQKA